MERRILHVDIDAFLASVEQLRDPVLIGKPVAVGTGVVASRSYEAKARGVHTAMPLHEALRRCPELIVRPGDARLVERFRQGVAEVLRRASTALRHWLIPKAEIDRVLRETSGMDDLRQRTAGGCSGNPPR